MAHKDNWKLYLVEQQAKEYSTLILENQQYLDEGIMDMLKMGGKALTRGLFPILAVNDLANLLEKSELATEIVHFTLDVAGFIPGFGEVADGLNVAWYIKKGEWFNAAMSILSLLPLAGDIIGKGAKWLGKGSKGFAKFLGKYGDDIAKIWKKAVGNPKMLKSTFKKLVDFVGGEKKFDEAINNMNKSVSEALKMKDEASNKAKNSAEKVGNDPRLQKKIMQKVADKQGGQAAVALQELQTSYGGYDGSGFPDDVYNYGGYASAIDGSGDAEFEESSIREGRKNWKKMMNEDAMWRILFEDERTENILRKFDDIKTQSENGFDVQSAASAIDELMKLDNELRDISKKAGHEVTFSNVSVGTWTVIVEALQEIRGKLMPAINVKLDYLIKRNGSGIHQAVDELNRQDRQKNVKFIERIGDRMGKRLDKDVAKYLIRILRNKTLLDRFNMGFVFGFKNSPTDIEPQDVITAEHLEKPLSNDKYAMMSNAYEIGEFLGTMMEDELDREELSSVAYRDARSPGIYRTTARDKITNLMDPKEHEANPNIKRDLALGLSQGIVSAHKGGQ